MSHTNEAVTQYFRVIVPACNGFTVKYTTEIFILEARSLSQVSF